MLKQLVVEVEVNGQTLTLELGLKGDGLDTLIAYSSKDILWNDTCGYKVFMKNEVGHKNVIGGQFISKENCIKFAEEGIITTNWQYQNSYDDPYYYKPGTPAFERYDRECPFLLEGILPPGTKEIVQTERADEIARHFVETCLRDDVLIEEYELNENGHVYGLNTGGALVIKGNGSISMILENGDRLDELERMYRTNHLRG